MPGRWVVAVFATTAALPDDLGEQVVVLCLLWHRDLFASLISGAAFGDLHVGIFLKKIVQ